MATTGWNPQRCRRGYRDKTNTDRDLRALHTLLGRTEVTYKLHPFDEEPEDMEEAAAAYAGEFPHGHAAPVNKWGASMEAELGSVPCVGWLSYEDSKNVVTSMLDPDRDLDMFNLTRGEKNALLNELDRVGGVEGVVAHSRAFVFRGVYVKRPPGSGLKIKRDNTRQPGQERWVSFKCSRSSPKALEKVINDYSFLPAGYGIRLILGFDHGGLWGPLQKPEWTMERDRVNARQRTKNKAEKRFEGMSSGERAAYVKDREAGVRKLKAEAIRRVKITKRAKEKEVKAMVRWEKAKAKLEDLRSRMEEFEDGDETEDDDGEEGEDAEEAREADQEIGDEDEEENAGEEEEEEEEREEDDDGASEEGEVEETEGTPEVGSKRQIPTTRRSTRKRQKGL